MPQEFLEETETLIIRNIHPAEMFVEDTFEIIDIGFDIELLVGEPRDPGLIERMINPDKKMVQSVRFKKPLWTLSEALDWLQMNQHNFNSISNLKKYRKDLKSINNVEIFSAGIWNGDEYTIEDLHEMVRAFEENKDGVRPFLKLGHDEKQPLLETDGLPAAGWIEKLFVKGDKLLANFVDIPQKIFELIENKAYRKVSSEIFWDIKIGQNVYKRMLAAVALLGSQTPGVMNLKDILANYKLKFKTYSENDLEIKIYMEDKEMPKSENEILLEQKVKDLELEIQNAADEKEKFTADLDAQKEENEKLKEYKKETEEKTAALEKEKHQAEVKAFVTELKSENLCTPAMEPMVSQLLGEDKKEYTLKVDKEEKKFSKFELVKEVLKLFSKADEVNFDENSEEGQKNKLDEAKKIEKYMADNKCDYATAYRAVINEIAE